MKRFFFNTAAVILSLILAVLLIDAAMSIADVPLMDFLNIDSSNSFDETGKYYYQRLSSPGKKAYKKIYAKLPEQREQIRIPELSDEELSSVFEALSYDNPEIIYLGTSCRTTVKNGFTFFNTDYTMSPEEASVKMAVLARKAEEIIASMPPNLNEQSKELFIHDYIVENCSYYNAADRAMIHTAYGALIEGYAACEGYSRAAQYLLNKLGISNFLITGKAINSEGNIEGHMWNIVRLDSENYHLDVTWDDPVTQNELSPSRVYVNLSDSIISKNHFEFDKNISNATSNRANYFYSKGLVFDSYNAETRSKIVNLLISGAAGKTSNIEFRFSNERAFEAAKADIFQGDRIYRMLSLANMSAKNRMLENAINYALDEDLFIIRLIPSYI